MFSVSLNDLILRKIYISNNNNYDNIIYYIKLIHYLNAIIMFLLYYIINDK